MQADGSIIIDTEIRTDGMKPGTKDIETSVRRMADSITDLGKKSEIALQKQVAAFSKMNAAYSDQERKVARLKAAMDEYAATKIPTDEYMEVSNQIEKAENKLNALTAQQERFLAIGGRKNSTAYQKMQYDMDELSKTIEYAKSELEDLEQTGQAFTLGESTEKFTQMSEQYESAVQRLASMNDSLGASYARIEYEADEYKKRLLEVDDANKETATSTKELGHSAKKASVNIKKASDATGSMGTGIKKFLAYGLGIRSLFVLFNKLRSGITEGMKNLTQYSKDTNTALSLLMSRFTQLKNSAAAAFSPLVEYAAPALANLISLLAEASNWTAQLLAALTGKDTFSKAVKVQQDYAASLDSTASSAKEATKALAPFDDLIQLQTKSSSTTTSSSVSPSDMFETVDVANEALALAEDVKAVFTNLFDPIKESWQNVGPQVTEAVKNAFTNLKQLASDVGSSFTQVWNIEGYGKTITDNLLQSFANLIQTVANLASQFDIAWNTGNIGTEIMRNLGNIAVEFTNFLVAATESIKNWAASLDFTPLLTAFNDVLAAITPIVSDVGDMILWLLDEVLLPLASWAVEQVLPTVFELIAAALDVVDETIDALKPMATWLWEEFLQPLGEWTGEAIIAALQKIVQWLTQFSNWISEHKKEVEAMTIVIISFFAAWTVVEFVNNVNKMLVSLGALTSKLTGLLTSGMNPIIWAIGYIVSLIAILAASWDDMTPQEQVISAVLAAASAVGILAVALGAVTGAVGAATVAAALIAGIAAAKIAIGAGQSNLTSSSSSSSGTSSYSTSTYSDLSYSMPALATGTVVPPRAGEFAAILGDNNTETEVVSPLSTMKQALKEALAETEINQGRNIQIDLIMNEQRFATAVYKANNQEKQRVGVRMVTQNG